MSRAIIEDPSLSLVRGTPLDEEEGLGSLTIPGYLREVCERNSDREALVLHGPDGITRWTYTDLWNESMQVARALIVSGVTKDSRVGILMTNRPEFISSLFGISMAGGVAVALSTFSTPPELEYLIKASDISVLLFEDKVLKKDFAEILLDLESQFKTASAGSLSSKVFPFLQKLVRLDGITAFEASAFKTNPVFESWIDFITDADKVDETVVAARIDTIKSSDIGGLFFSSGTTSLPKGILHTHRGFALQWWRWPLLMDVKESARTWTGNGFFWSGNVTSILGVAFSTGGAVVLQPLFDADAAIKLLEAEKVTFMNGRPHQWARMQSSPEFAKADLSTLHYITRGELLQEHPTVDTDWEVPMLFGTTETMSLMTGPETKIKEDRPAGSCGIPLPGNLIKIVDPQSGDIVPLGERGEICIKGPSLMIGYIGKTLEDIFDDEGYYCTGDGGYVDTEGRLFWEGRLNDIIKTGGANVSPQEIDELIAKFPGVKRTQTVGVPHDTLSEMVVSCIVPVDGVTLDAAELISFLKEQLASFKIPREVLFFTEAEYPLTGNEKVKASDVKQLACKRLSIES